MKTQRRKRLGYITEEQETAELLQETNGGGGGSYTDPTYQDPVYYPKDPIYQGGEVVTDIVPTETVAPDQQTIDAGGDTLPTTAPAKTINWPLLIAVAIGLYLVTKKS